MGFLKNFCFLLPLFWVMVVLGLFPVVVMGADDTNFVFKGCADQKFQDPSDVYTQNLNTLLSTLVSQSSEKTFSTTTSGQDQSAITGAYQCRGDLTTDKCSTCVSKIAKMIEKLCGKSIAARLQLNGCYLEYEVSWFKQVAGTEFLYKVCGSSQETGSEFENKRDTAFSMAEDGVKNGSGLFYTGDYQSLYVLGQCEGDLGANDCGDCLKTAFQRVKEECADSISGQVYLQKCYISYSYYPNGLPNISSSSSPDAEGKKQHTQRTVAIAVGGLAAFGFVVVCLMCIKSVMKKQRQQHRSSKYDG
ncbi:hypothetical protein SLE2022_247550 [Rubroshorea leprosula]